VTSASLETVTGRVDARNERGIRIGEDWFNRSQFHPVELPETGAQVRLGIDSKGFIRTVELVDQNSTGSTASRERTISRLAVLKAAAAFGASRPDLKSGDVLKIAAAWLEWVERE
jgi:hypothetical protein